MKSKKNKFVFLLLSFIGSIGIAGATTLAPNPLLNIQGQGVSVATGGAGMVGRVGMISVDIGGPVISATLYWAGRDYFCADDGMGGCIIPNEDTIMLLDGQPVPADRLIGSEIGCCAQDNTNNIGYAADVTDIVVNKGQGLQVFTVEDGDVANWNVLAGASLLVIYADQADTQLYEVIVYEGQDFAYHNSQPDPAKVTEPVTFAYDAVEGMRVGQITIFVGDANAGRPDVVRIDGNAIDNSLDADEGARWDDDLLPATIAGGATSTTIQLFSEQTDLGTNPDSMAWSAGILRIPVFDEEPPPGAGRMTGGKNMNIGGSMIRGGMTIHCDITLSNNLQIKWGRNNWHLDKPITQAICIDDPAIDPEPPAAPFDTFIGEGFGKLNGVDGSFIRFTFIDAGGSKSTKDFAEISIWAVGANPGTDSPILTGSAFLDGGNIQAHFDQPHKN
jgi:hypothetical protein